MTLLTVFLILRPVALTFLVICLLRFAAVRLEH